MTAIPKQGSFGRKPLRTIRGLPPGQAPRSPYGEDVADEQSGVSVIAEPRRHALRRARVRPYRRPRFDGIDQELSPVLDLEGRTVTEWPPRPVAANDNDPEDVEKTTTGWEEIDVTDLEDPTFVDDEPPAFADDPPARPPLPLPRRRLQRAAAPASPSLPAAPLPAASTPVAPLSVPVASRAVPASGLAIAGALVTAMAGIAALAAVLLM